MTAQKTLQHREEERDALLQNIASRIGNDPRVVAAWLFGSIGRGEQDALSDLDVFVIVEDAHIETVSEARREFVAALGKPLLVVEAPQNGPRGGAYLMALYPGETGPHEVDWYWQARSQAKIPQQTVLLFDKAGLPHDDKPTTFTEMNPPGEWDRATAITNTVAFFWAMLLITAKYAFRSPDEEQMGLLPYVLKPLQEAAAFAEVGFELSMERIIPHSDFAGKFDLLLALAAEMEMLMPKLEAKGVSVPKEIIPQAEAFLELIRNSIESRAAGTATVRPKDAWPKAPQTGNLLPG